MSLEKIKIYLGPVIAVLASFAAVYIFIFPAASQIMITRGEIAVLEDRRSKLAAKAQVLESVSETTLRADLAAAEISLPTDKNASGMISGLENLAASAGARLLTFSTAVGKMATAAAGVTTEKPVEEKELPNNVKSIKVETSLVGTYDQIQSFLGVLNNVNRLVGIDTLAVDKTTGKLILLVFYQPLLKTLGDVTSPVEDITAAERNSLRQATQYQLATPELPTLPAGKANPFQ